MNRNFVYKPPQPQRTRLRRVSPFSPAFSKAFKFKLVRR